MSASPDFMQGLLQSIQPWLTGASPSKLDDTFAQYGGTQGLLNAMLQQSPGAPGAAAFGQALQGNKNDALRQAAARQQLAEGGIGLQRSAMTLPFLGQYYQGLMGMMGGQGGNAAPAAGNALPAAGGAQAPPSGATPQAAPGGPTAASAGSPSGAPASMSPAGGGSQGTDPMSLLRMATFGSAIGAPGADALANLAKTQLQYDPQTQARLEAAKSAIGQDQYQIQQAIASGNMPLAQALSQKMRQDLGLLHIASMSGTQTRIGLNGDISTFNPNEGVQTVGGVESAIPGAAQARGALAGAQAGAQEAARLGAATAPAGGGPGVPPWLPPGSAASIPRAPAAAASQSAQYQGSEAMRQEGYIPPVLSAPSAIPQRPGNTSLGQLESFQKQQSERASTLAEQLNEQAQNAQMLLTQAGQIDDAARDFSPGKLANIKREMLAWGQSIPGLLSDSDLKSLGSAQEGDKLSIQLQAMVTKQLGSREAAQVFSVMGRSIPNLTLSPDGLAKISSYLKGVARYQIAQNTFGQRLAAQGNVAGVNGLQSNFQTYSNPVYYILSSAPPSVAQEFIANMAPAERTKIQAGWKKAISLGLAPAPGD